MTRGTLERSVLALESFAVELVTIIAAVIFVIASPPAGNTLAIAAPELRLGTVTILALALGFRFVATITTVIGKVAHPLFWNASVVVTLEVRLRITFGAIFRQLVAIVAAIVLTIAEQPLRNAPVVGLSGATAPPGSTIPLSAHVGWFVRVIATIVIEIAHPQLWNTATVLAAELRLRIARSFMTNLRIFIASVLTIRVTIALPAVQNTPSTRFTLKVRHRARQIAVLLIAAIPTVICSITNRRRRSTVSVATLERTSTAVSCWTGLRFVRLVLAVRFAVTLPEPRNALLIGSTAPVLSSCAVSYAGLAVPRQVELIRAGALVAWGSLFDVTFHVQVGRLQWWRE